MSEHSLIIALEYGEKLKEFDDISQAENILFHTAELLKYENKESLQIGIK